MNKTLCIFCGSQEGSDPKLAEHTYRIGKMLAQQGTSAVCGGSQKGLMRILIDSMLDYNGHMTGIYPTTLMEQQPPHPKLKHAIETTSLFDRKEKMLTMSDAFLVLPGAYGTLDEWFEIMVLIKIHALKKPIILYNFKGFWDDTLMQMERIEQCGFATQDARNAMKVCPNYESLSAELKQLAQAQDVPTSQEAQEVAEALA